MVRKRLRLRWVLLLCLFLIPIGGTTFFRKEYGPAAEGRTAGGVAIHMSDGRREVSLSLDEYLKGATAAQLSPDAAEEMVKAMMVVNRTCVFYVAGDRMTLEGEWLGQPWLSSSERKEKGWSEKKLERAVSDTKDCMIYSGDDPILPLYFRISNGKTRSAKDVWGQDVSWLVPTESLWDKNAPDHTRAFVFSVFRLAGRLEGQDPEAKNWRQITPSMIQIVGKDDSGYVRQIQIGSQVYDGETLRYLLDLPSACFDVTVEDGRTVFVCYGEGHGVGLSLYGGNAMALSGSDYTQILSYYFAGTKIR